MYAVVYEWSDSITGQYIKQLSIWFDTKKQAKEFLEKEENPYAYIIKRI